MRKAQRGQHHEQAREEHVERERQNDCDNDRPATGALPGSFKNLLDWTIGDDQPGSIYGKPVAWVNASPRGAEGAHRELRTVLEYAHAAIVEAACRSVPVTSAMIGPDGIIADPATAERVGDVLRALVDALVD